MITTIAKDQEGSKAKSTSTQRSKNAATPNVSWTLSFRLHDYCLYLVILVVITTVLV